MLNNRGLNNYRLFKKKSNKLEHEIIKQYARKGYSANCLKDSTHMYISHMITEKHYLDLR